MMEEILKLIYDYSSNNKIIDKKYLEKVVSLFVNYYNLHDCFNGFVFKDFHENNAKDIAGYSYKAKTIYIFNNPFNEEVTKKSLIDSCVPINQKILLKNVELTHIILHEIEHIIQAKIMCEKTSTESEILKLSGISKSQEIIRNRLKNQGYSEEEINNIINNKMKMYYKYYSYAPPERLAEINSFEKMAKILEPIKGSIPKIHQNEIIKMEQNMLKGYKYNNQLISPTSLFLKEQGEEKYLRKFDWFDNNQRLSLKKSKKHYSFSDRIKLGLPIELSEYNKEEIKVKRLLSSL